MSIFKKKAPAKKAEATTKKEAAHTHDHAHDHAHAAPAVARATGEAYRILMRPLVTEKFSGQAGSAYAFEVAPKSNKLEIRKAIQEVYGVHVTDVRVMNVPGKVVRSKTGYGKRADWRKAVVIIKPGESIDIFAAKNA